MSRTGIDAVPNLPVSGTGIDVPNLPKCPVPVWKSVPVPAVPLLMLYRSYRSVRYRYCCRTELTEVFGTGNTGGTYRQYASVRTVPNTPLQCTITRGFFVLEKNTPSEALVNSTAVRADRMCTMWTVSLRHDASGTTAVKSALLMGGRGGSEVGREFDSRRLRNLLVI